MDNASQHNPQNMVVGEAMIAQVVEALANGPGWAKSLLVLTYDEHGGYYDHVPPPVALAPTPSLPSWWPARGHTTASSATVSTSPG